MFMAYWDKQIQPKKEEKVIPPSPLEDVLGEYKFFLDGRGANLYVYEDCIVLDRTQGGLFNIGNRTYKVIPIKNILAMQIKSIGATTGFLEFATYGHENTDMKGLDRVNDENNINFGTEESAKVAREILIFILNKIRHQ